jgi:uncharacterized membrane protein YfcA
VDLAALWGSLAFSLLDWLEIVAGIATAHVVVGISGFGAALLVGPLLLHFLPLSTIIPAAGAAAFGVLFGSRRFPYALYADARLAGQ